MGVLESPGFSISKRVGTLFIYYQLNLMHYTCNKYSNS